VPVEGVALDAGEPGDVAQGSAMHGGTLTGDVLPAYNRALGEHEFAYRGLLLGREVGAAAAAAAAAA
jgi:hypothetical protein